MTQTTTRPNTSRRARTPRQKRLRTWWLIASTAVLAVLVVVLFFALRGGYDTYIRSTYELQYYDTVMQACRDYEVEPALVYAVIRTESGFDEKAHSSADAMGLMQVTDTALAWAQFRSDEFDDVTVEQLYEPHINIRVGVYVLSLLFEQFESEQAVIAAYNAGIGNVEEWLTDPAYSSDGVTLHTVPFEETRHYLERVTSSKAIYEDLYPLELVKGDIQ